MMDLNVLLMGMSGNLLCKQMREQIQEIYVGSIHLLRSCERNNGK